jgi:putative transposase
MMARPLRIQFENALYHVTSRGNEKAALYGDDQDRFVFIKLLSKVVEQYTWVVYAYCLMGNHYHLLVRTPKANLSRGMRQLNGIYAQYFNKRHERVGHLFQGRFAVVLIKDEERLLTVARYVVLNPVRAGIIATPEDWRWSSFCFTVGINKPPSFFDPDRVLCFFSGDRELACRQYVAFVSGGIGKESPLSDARGGILTGGDTPIEVSMARLMGEISDEVPKRERLADRPTLENIFSGNDRDMGIYKAFCKYEYKLKEIGSFLGLHYSVVSRIAKKIGEG